MSIKRVILIPVLSLLAATMLGQSSPKISGTVTDSMCGKRHMMQGKTDAQCTRDCVKSGSNYALISGDKIYMLKGDKAQIDKFAGASVEIEGKTSGNTVTVKSIKAAE